MTRSLALAGLMAFASSGAFAQTQASTTTPILATRLGHEINISLQHYNYTEPDDVDISIHGPKFGAEYTGTFALSQRSRWFAQINVRGTGAVARYDGWCRPYQITPSSTSANGYRLTFGERAQCSETGDADFYVDGRALIGKDLIGSTWAFTPFAGIGLRHLANGVTGNFNYRTDEYAYVPVGMTVRLAPSAAHVLGITVEYDHLIRGWQKTRQSLLGGGTVPATSTTPAFTISDFTDMSFDQHTGKAFRASASYQVSRRWSIEPYFTRWRVEDSPVFQGSVALTVNAITVRQSLGFYEPHNFTNEAGVKIGLRFGGR